MLCSLNMKDGTRTNDIFIEFRKQNIVSVRRYYCIILKTWLTYRVIELINDSILLLVLKNKTNTEF